MDKKLSQTGLSLLALVQPCLTRNILGHPSMATDPINKPTNFHTIYYFISPYISIVPPTVLSSNSTPLCELYAPPSRICPVWVQDNSTQSWWQCGAVRYIYRYLAVQWMSRQKP